IHADKAKPRQENGIGRAADGPEVSRSGRREIELGLALHQIHAPFDSGEHFDLAPRCEVDSDAGGVILNFRIVLEGGEVSTQLAVRLEHSDKVAKSARFLAAAYDKLSAAPIRYPNARVI